MRFLADECCPGPVVDWLRSAGHDVLYASEDRRGAPDFDLLATAFEEGRLLITEDFDFGELTVRARAPTYGVVLIAMGAEPIELRVARVRELILRHSDDLTGHLTIVDAHRIRRRPLGAP